MYRMYLTTYNTETKNKKEKANKGENNIVHQTSGAHQIIVLKMMMKFFFYSIITFFSPYIHII